METDTFPTPMVRQALRSFKLVRVDVTNEPTPEAKQLIQAMAGARRAHHGFPGQEGQAHGRATVVGFLGPDDFHDRLVMALARAGDER